MKRIILLAVMLTLIFSAGTAQAAKSGFYIGARGALSNVFGSDIDWGAGSKSDGDFFSFGGGPVLGFDFAAQNGPPLRLEAEVLFRSGDDWKKTVNINSVNFDMKFEVERYTTFLANLCWDLAALPAGGLTFKPFIGLSAGFGYISYELKVNSYSEDGSEAAFLIGPGGGLRIDFNDSVAADIGIRYLFSGDYDIEGADYDANILDFNFGLVYKF